jgi:hypothetical protein
LTLTILQAQTPAPKAQEVHESADQTFEALISEGTFLKADRAYSDAEASAK